MTHSDILDIQRLTQLIENDLRTHFKTILITGAILVLFFLVTSFSAASDQSTYFSFLYIAGFLISSTAFNDLHNPLKAHLLLTLPCSNLERFLSKWLLTSAGFAIVLLLVFYIFSLLGVVVNEVIYQQKTYPLNIHDPQLWRSIGKYIILQSIVFLGSVIFKKNTLLKTALALGCFFLLLNLFSCSIASLFCTDCVQQGLIFYSLFKGEYFIFWSLIAPFCWYATYLRLSQHELR